MKKARALKLWSKAGTGAGVENLISKQIVSFSAVAAARAHLAMVSVDVHDVIAKWAMERFVKNGHSQPAQNHGSEMMGVNMFV